jgi:hypothetical protein
MHEFWLNAWSISILCLLALGSVSCRRINKPSAIIANSGRSTAAVPARPSIEQQRREAKRLVDEYLALVPGTGSNGKKDEAVNSLRLLGWAATAVVWDRLNKTSKDRQKNALVQEKMPVLYKQEMRLSKLWAAVCPVPLRPPHDCYPIPPEYCYGGRRIECPDGLEHVYEKLTPAEASKSSGVAEEYCRRNAADGTSVKHGPYTLFGPNGEAIEQGNYVDGQRDGKWVYTSAVQVSERVFNRGKPVSETTVVVGEPTWLVIDFNAANRQKVTLWCALGSTTYEIFSREGEFCRMRYTGEVESAGMWSEKNAIWVELLVPRSLGKRTFSKTATGVDFSSLQKYLVKPEK